MGRIIGLTGGIASGKSMASAFFRAKGLVVVDADQIARTLTQAHAEGSVAVAQHFGPAYLDQEGAMDRRAMRELVFQNPQAREQLEAILHPLILHDAQAQLTQALTHHPLVIFDCPLLCSHAYFRDLVDTVLVIDASDETRIARLAERNRFSRQESQRIMTAQLPRTSLLRMAHIVVINEGKPLDFEASLTQLYTSWGL